MNKEEREESWRFIDLVGDYKRMGVPNNLWVTTAANSEYRVSGTCLSLPLLIRHSVAACCSATAFPLLRNAMKMLFPEVIDKVAQFFSSEEKKRCLFPSWKLCNH